MDDDADGVRARAALQAVPTILDDAATALPRHLRAVLTSVHEEIRAIEERIAELETELRTLAEGDPVVMRLRTIPGIGLLTATALVGSVGHIHAFRRARQFASWLGLTPREHSSGHRRRLGAIREQGDVYLRCLLTHGARSVLLMAHRRAARGQSLTRLHHWALALRARRGHNKATIAIAREKLGRIVCGRLAEGRAVRDAGRRVTRPDSFHARCSASDLTHGPSVRPDTRQGRFPPLALEADATIGPRCATVHTGREAKTSSTHRPDIRPQPTRKTTKYHLLAWHPGRSPYTRC